MIKNLPRPSVLDRFRANWAADINGCHIWTGSRNEQGYGIVQIANRKQRAHRVAFELAYGEIPEDPDNPIVVRHKCDNPPCVNPAHLELGTKADNNRDTADRGRHWKQRVTQCPQGHPYSGENLYMNPGGSRQCRACCNAVSRIGKEHMRRRRGAKPHLTAEQVCAIRDEYASGCTTQQALASKYGVTQPSISRIVHGGSSD